jgi:hypothetical protein
VATAEAIVKVTVVLLVILQQHLLQLALFHRKQLALVLEVAAEAVGAIQTAVLLLALQVVLVVGVAVIQTFPMFQMVMVVQDMLQPLLVLVAVAVLVAHRRAVLLLMVTRVLALQVEMVVYTFTSRFNHWRYKCTLFHKQLSQQKCWLATLLYMKIFGKMQKKLLIP